MNESGVFLQFEGADPDPALDSDMELAVFSDQSVDSSEYKQLNEKKLKDQEKDEEKGDTLISIRNRLRSTISRQNKLKKTECAEKKEEKLACWGKCKRFLGIQWEHSKLPIAGGLMLAAGLIPAVKAWLYSK